MTGRRKKKLFFRRKRFLDLNVVIDYKQPDILMRFITDRGKIIPRRISGATASQQRQITKSIKRARYLALLPFSVNHRQEKSFASEMAAIAAGAAPLRGRPDIKREERFEDESPEFEIEE